MKTIHLMLQFVLLAISQMLTAQALPYQYSFWKEQFTPLAGATVMPQSVWIEDVVPIPLLFPFKIADKTFQTLQIDATSGTLFGNLGLTEGDSLQAIFGYSSIAGLENEPGTQISYKFDGIAPHRIFKVEWLKAGLLEVNGSVSFQIWLHESSNVIQIKLGPQNVPQVEETFFNGKSPTIGLALNMYLDEEEFAVIGYAHFVKGDVQVPDDIILSDFYSIVITNPAIGCEGLPLEGSVFTFTPGNITALNNPGLAESLQFFPNPAAGEIHFTQPAQSEADIQFLDIQGRVVFSSVVPAGTEKIDLPATLEPGTYIVRRVVEGKIAVGKLILA